MYLLFGFKTSESSVNWPSVSLFGLLLKNYSVTVSDRTGTNLSKNVSAEAGATSFGVLNQSD